MKIAAFVLTIILASVCNSNSEIRKGPFSLKLDQETYLTNTNGVANPVAIINAKPGETVRIYLPDGTVFGAIVKEASMQSEGVFKLFGDLTKIPNAGFGFVLTKDGIFAGAIVQRDTNTIHKLYYDEEAKGYIFKYTTPTESKNNG